MLPEERQFPRFVTDVGVGLYRTLLSDPDVFLLGVSGFLRGSGRRLRGIGDALVCYVVFHRLDRYIEVAVQLHRVAHINGRPPSHPVIPGDMEA